MGLQDRDYMRKKRGGHFDTKDHIYNPKIFRGSRQKNGTPPSAQPASSIPQKIVWFVLWLGVLFLCAKIFLEYSRSQAFPETGSTHWFSMADHPKKALLRIEAPKGSLRKYVVQLNDAQSGEPVVHIFIHPGETSFTVLPLGRYTATIYKGLMWQGTRYLFGITGEMQKMPGSLDFYQTGNEINGYRVRLDATIQGWGP